MDLHPLIIIHAQPVLLAGDTEFNIPAIKPQRPMGRTGHASAPARGAPFHRHPDIALQASIGLIEPLSPHDKGLGSRLWSSARGLTSVRASHAQEVARGVARCRVFSRASRMCAPYVPLCTCAMVCHDPAAHCMLSGSGAWRRAWEGMPR